MKINFNKYAPASNLSRFIQSYFVISTGVYCKDQTATNNLPLAKDSNQFLKNHPQGSVDLMFTLRGEGVKIITADDKSNQYNDIFILAQQEGKFELKFSEDLFIVGVVFYGESFKKLFNFPLQELSNSGLVVSDELNESYGEIHAQLQQSLTEHEIVGRLNEFFNRQLSQIDFSFTKFDQLIEHIRLTNGQLQIDQIAELSNLSTRTLQRRMKEVIGVSPKSYSSIMRFKQVMNLLNSSTTTDWQDILFNCGYYDQAHFIKDFKKYTGHTPKSFLNDDSSLSDFFASQHN